VKLIVFGASGGCGQWAVKLAVARGWTVTASVRDMTPYVPPNGVTVVRGDVLDSAHVASIVAGHDVVLSCLGPQRVNPRNPWSGLRSPPAFATRSADNLIAAARSAGITRIGAISAAGVGESVTSLNVVMKFLLARSTIGEMYADLADMETRYAASGLDWFAVRPVTLVNANPSHRARELTRFGMTSVIARADVAQWMLDGLVSHSGIGTRTPQIGWW
jgi:putative NADH-flavin reductase